MYIITGGAGFIGSNIAKKLAATEAAPVVICDYFGTDEKWQNLSGIRIDDVVPPTELSDYLSANKDAIKAVIHMGAISATTERDVDLIIRSNIVLTRTLWDWCAEAQKQFIYASSAATYGDGAAGFDDEFSATALDRLKPLNAYGWSKHVSDCRIARIVEAGGKRPPQWMGLKFFNVYGPREDHKGDMMSVIAKIEPAVARGEGVKLFKSHRPDYEDGGQKRDFVFVEDCANVISWALETPSVSGLFNLGTGEARTFKNLAEAVFAAHNRPADITYIDKPLAIRDKYQYFTEARMDRLRAAGYDKPFTRLEDGVFKYVHDYLMHRH